MNFGKLASKLQERVSIVSIQVSQIRPFKVRGACLAEQDLATSGPFSTTSGQDPTNGVRRPMADILSQREPVYDDNAI